MCTSYLDVWISFYLNLNLCLFSFSARMCDVFEVLASRLECLEAWVEQDRRVRLHTDNIAPAGTIISGLLHCGRPIRIIKHYSGDVQPGSLMIAHGSLGSLHGYLPVLFYRVTDADRDLGAMVKRAESAWAVQVHEIEFFVVPERSEATADFLEHLVRLVNGSDGDASLIARARAAWQMLPEWERRSILACHDPHEFLQHDVMCFFIST